MSKKRIRVLVRGLSTGRVELDAGTAHYVTRVHRLRDGDECLAADVWAGAEADARVSVESGRVGLVLGAARSGERTGCAGLCLVLGLAKGDKVDQVLRSAVALGASELCVVHTARSVPSRDEHSLASSERLDAIAADVARQSGRSNLPKLTGPLAFASALALQAQVSGASLVLHPADGAAPLLEVLDRLARAAPAGRFGLGYPLRVWVGPEGGFDEAELAALGEAGALTADLGELVLRTELAASAALAATVAWWGWRRTAL